MAKKRRKTTRTTMSVEEKTLKTLQSIFILEALKEKIAGHEIRQILGVAMEDVTKMTKVLKKAKK